MIYCNKLQDLLVAIVIVSCLWVGGSIPAFAENKNVAKPQTTRQISVKRVIRVFRDCEVCPEMVSIEAADLPNAGKSSKRALSPNSPNSSAAPFAISKFEITWNEWLECVNSGICTRVPNDHGWGRGTMPIINVTWHEAKEYVLYLSNLSGKSYRLPTEWEWELAAKAGTNTRYWWGDEVGKNNANCRKCGSNWDGHGSAPVGSFAPNPFGLFDMNGNVWEWTADCWVHENSLKADLMTGSQHDNCKNRVIKSGSWYYIPKLITAEARDKYPAALFSYNIGIRVVRDLE